MKASMSLGLVLAFSASAAVAEAQTPPAGSSLWQLPPPPAGAAAATPAQTPPAAPPAASAPVEAPRLTPSSAELPRGGLGPLAALSEGEAPHRAPSMTRERLRLLNATLLPLSERSREARRSEGVRNLLVGAGVMALGFLLQPGDDRPSPFSDLLFFQGGWQAATGLAGLVIAPSRERLSEEYGRLPYRTGAQRRGRVRFGEEALEEAARDGTRRRVLQGVAGLVYGLGNLAIIYRDQIFNGAPMPEPAELNYLVIGLASVSTVYQLIDAFSRSDDERRRDNYRREVELLRETAAVEAAAGAP